MKVVIFSDLHMDHSTAGAPRYEDAERAMRAVFGHATNEGAKLVVFDGDLCDPDSPELIRCVTAAQRVAWDYSEGEEIRSLWVAGNHDVLEDGLGTTVLDPITPDLEGYVQVCKAPDIHTIAGLLVLCLPYTALSHSYDPVEFCKQHAGSKVDLIVGHLMLEGISQGSETEDFPRGRDVFWPLEEIEKHWPGVPVVAGHYHSQQRYRGVHIPGSLLSLTRADVGARRGFLEIEV